VAEPAEPDVDEPRLPVDVDAQREVVERRAEAVRGGGPPSVEQAIQMDPRLQPAQKEALVRVYRSFLGEG